MGAYLTSPKTEKESHNETYENLVIGVSGMQGWRMSMEDAYCCLTNFDEKKNSLFGVFDGHGGKEVAEYCARNFYKFLLDSEAYQEGNLVKALQDSFMSIDEALTSEEVVKELRELGGIPQEEQQEEDEAAMLLEEANMPIEELLERLKGNLKENGFIRPDKEEPDESEIPTQNGHVDSQENIESKSSKRKQKKPVKNRAAGPEPDLKIPTEESSVEPASTSADDGALNPPSAGGSGTSSCDTVAGSSLGNVTDDHSSGLTATDSKDCDPDFKVDDGDSESEASGTEEDREEESSEEDDDEDSDSDDEFEDSEGVEFQPGNDEVGKDSGTTAIVALLYSNKLYVANVGDSRCVLCRNGEPIEMSLDHKPEDEMEKQRIEKAGGKITADGRVNGGLNLSRAIGDHAYKQNKDIPPEDQAITAFPDVKEIEITKEDDFMVLACDGIWNMMSSEEVIDFIKERIYSASEEAPKLSTICEELFDRCLAPDMENDGSGCDNMTCLIVRFKSNDSGTCKTSVCKKRNGQDMNNSEENEAKKAKLSDLDVS